MQSAATVLGVIRERGRQGLPLERLYRQLFNPQLFNPQLFLLAYGRIYSNHGSMTPGVTAETVDGMSQAKIGAIIDALRSESYRWSAARRVYIEKKGTRKKRPLGLPTWSDKIVSEVVRLLLEAYYDVRFSDRSHGFRRGRGCHTALSEVVAGWTGTHWFIEGDISDCFGSLDREVMVSTLAQHIHDGRFLRLIERMLQAGFLEDWIWNATLSGVPQGGTASPILSNIYLDRLDRFVEDQLLPQHNRGDIRRRNPEYLAVKSQIEKAQRRGDRRAVALLKQQRHKLPSGDPNDPGYRRLRYVRYCDDWLLGFAGPKHEAEQIKAEVGKLLRDELKLELSESKTVITHAASQAAHFLGYEIRVQHNDTKITRGRRTVNGVVGLFVPKTVIRQRCARYMGHGKPAARGQLLHDTDYTIVEKYGTEYRGFVQYYLLAQDVSHLNKLHWVMQTSMLKTLAAKHKSTVAKMARKYKAVIDTPDGSRTCYQAVVPRPGKALLVARFGGIPLKRKRTAVLTDKQPIMAARYNELIHRLLTGKCELCDARDDLQVHHVRKLADLHRPGRPARPPWVLLMARRRRKTLVVCQTCHHDIHKGRAKAHHRK